MSLKLMHKIGKNVSTVNKKAVLPQGKHAMPKLFLSV